MFRQDVGARKKPEVDPETGSLLSAQNIETLESFEDGISGYFGKILQWLEDFIDRGVQEGKFTKPGRIFRSSYAIPLPVTIWMCTGITTKQSNG